MSYSPPRRPLRFARSLFLSGAAALLLAPLAAGAQDSASTATAQSRAKNADWLYAGSDIPRDTAWQFGVLPNGVRYAVRNNGVPPGQVSIRVRMDVGSMFETDEERGYAHLLEHLTRSEEHTSELQSLMRISNAVFCLKKKIRQS